MLWRALSIWLVMLLLAIANGAFRVAVLIPWLGSSIGHVASTLLLSAILAALIGLALGWVGPPSVQSAIVIGLGWALLTIAFEFGFGRLVAHKSWQELFADYDVSRGRIWPLVLVTIVATPYLVARAQHRAR